MDPQFSVVMAFVQALSEYTPMFGDVEIVPMEFTLWLTEIAAYVDAMSVNAAIVRRITIDFEDFMMATVVAPLI